MAISLLVIVGLILLALLGAPLFIIIGSAALAGFYFAEIELTVVAIELYRIVDTPLLMALPLFTLTGYLLAKGDSSQRLVNLSQAALGWLPGSLALIAFLSCAFFTAFTGASGVTIVALGALLYPALQQAGYTEKFSLGLVTTSGSLGLLLAPSLPLILYGIIAQQMPEGKGIEITDLFLAGLTPAFLMIFALSVWTYWKYGDPTKKNQASDPISLKSAIWDARWELPLPLFVLGGIYSGFFAVSEAAAVMTLYVLVIKIWGYKEIKVSELPKLVSEAMVMVGGILLILGLSLAFTNWMVDAEIPTQLFELIKKYIDSPLMFLLLLNLLLLLLGAILDIFSATIIMVPLLLPVAVGYGIDPVHLGIIFLANMQIGYFTPPVGMNLFIASYRFKRPMQDLYKASLPFFWVLLVILLMITYIPAISLWPL